MAPRKNKKPSKNGFWQFVLECRDKNPHKNMTMDEAKDYASKKWVNMSVEERQPYDLRAALTKNNYKPVKYTTDGYEIEEVERQQKEAENKIQNMKHHITTNLKTASLAGNLDEQNFIIIHINHLTHFPAQDKYFICEVALASVNLRNGINEIFHRIVKPGKLPLGFYGPALTHSKETHQLIEIVQDEPYEDNTGEVFYEMVQFMKKHGDRQLPILYSDENTFEMTNKVISNLSEESEFSDEIKIYNMQYLFFALKNAAAGKNVWPTETFSYNEIEKDLYCYCPNIGCEFHEMADNSTYCSKSIVTRYAFTICDNCCGELNIQLIPGAHVPLKSRIASDTTKFSSRSSSICNIDQGERMGSMSSISSRECEGKYPSLGNQSSAPSVVSFSSMKSKEKINTAMTSNALELDQAFQTSFLNKPRRNHQSLKFPTPGYKHSQQ